MRQVLIALMIGTLTGCAGSTGTGDDGGGSADGGHDGGSTWPDAAIDDAGPASDAAVAPDAARDAGPGDAASPADAGTNTDADAGSGADAGGCPSDITCVDTFPFHDEGDTTGGTVRALDGYACAPTTNESGPEVVYQVTVPGDGFLSAAVYDGAGVDVDVHILSARDAAQCLDRGDRHARADVTAGTWFVVVDTYVSGGAEQVGPYVVDIGFLVPSTGPCELQTGEMPRVNDDGDHLAMPATGPIVKEAHLVTQEEPQPYPSTSTEELAEHYALSQAATGLVMYRSEHWAPLEGGDFYGAGIGSPTLFPVVDEGWYVNMYWTSAARPTRGTRMILRDPDGGSRAVVVSAGFETGPGNLDHLGGTPEETHFYLGTSHLSPMQIGIAVDQTLPLGPRRCE